MKIAKKAAVVLCAGLMLISPGVVSRQVFGEFPATLTVKAAVTTHDISQGNVTISDSGEHIITGDTTEHKVIISSGCSPTIKIRDLTIDLSAHSGSVGEWIPIDFSSAGECKLIIEGTNIINGGYNCPGIKTGSSKLTIDGTGTLEIEGGHSWPGIGSNGNCNLVIDGGTIRAYGGRYAAGIGGSWGCPGGTVVVNGGSVFAMGGEVSSGIGGGYQSTEGVTFTINGGTVTAYGQLDDEHDIYGTKNLNGGIVNGVNYTPLSSYTVTIPATVTLGESVDIKVSDVVLGNYKAIEVKLLEASGKNNTFTLSCDGREIPYDIKMNDENGTKVNVGDKILSATGDKSVKLYFTKPAEVPEYPGNYTGTLRFVFTKTQ